MNNGVTRWKEQDHWTWKEFVVLLLIEFVFVVGFIKLIVMPVYTQWFGNELYSGVLMGLTIAIVLMAGLYWVALRPKGLSWSELGARSFPAKDWGRILFWSFLIIVGGVVVITLTSFIGNTYENSKTEALQQNATFFNVLLALFGAAIISPLYEELFYRGFLYRWLRTRTGLGWALVLSSLIFTVAHYPTTNVMPVNFLSGMIFAWAYERSNSIWPGMIVHGLTNTVGVLLTVSG